MGVMPPITTNERVTAGLKRPPEIRKKHQTLAASEAPKMMAM